MTKKNPFTQEFDHQKDVELVSEAIEGSREALNKLVTRHNNFIYNICLKMLGNPVDAEDLTQDILIKVITNLSSYQQEKAQFRTWLYRIAFNTILNYKKSKNEKGIHSFQQFFDFVGEIEDDKNISDDNLDQLDPLSEEAKIKCMTGMLMCVPREDRLLYIVGDLFEVDHNLGAEMFQISKANFRKKLSRIRQQLRQWMNNKCGLVNKDNPCRCTRKTKGFIEGFSSRIKDYTHTHFNEILISSDKIYASLYQQHPLKDNKPAEQIINDIISDDHMRAILDF